MPASSTCATTSTWTTSSAGPGFPVSEPASRRPVAARRPAEIRIIGGRWKRTRLAVPDLPGLRPTPDRVRETLFNWLGQDLTGWRCLDAFAGTGALGLEAASRGAAAVRLVENQPPLRVRLQQTVQRLDATQVVQVEGGDGVAVLRRQAPASLDLILLDPPFDARLFAPALQAAARACAESGWIYLEAPRACGQGLLQPDPADGDADADALASLGLELHRHLRAGAVHAHLLRRVPPR
ncbi:MAG: 16S rRNA (guanine(966)-N(2))-methyltransferase RsmD [Rhodoferax sp.]|nr:16S rRNA (guanine(966)-N(2))-methyltransferase RsmD [Rhodoferax sp.]